MKKRVCSMTAALLLLGIALASCGEVGSDPAENTGSAPADTAAETEAAPAFPDYGGYEFRICDIDSNFAYSAVDVENETGEPLDDAVYRRNAEVEDAFNITISADDMSYKDVITRFKDNVMAADNVYDVYFDEIGQFFSNGVYNTYLTDMQNVSSVHFDKPWWNESAMDIVQLDNRRFFLFNDINVMFYESFAVFFVNRTMANDLDLPDFYTLVEDGKWTFDVLKDCVLAASKDLDGNGRFTNADQFGCVCYSDSAPGFFIAANTHMITKDSDGKPVWNGVSQRMTDVYDKIVDCLFGNANAVRTPYSPDIDDMQADLFRNGQSLFFFEPIGSAKVLRDVDFEVGIIPYPKYDEAQEDYGSYINSVAAACVAPITCPDAEKVGSILELMAEYSHEYVRPAYFDTTLNFKYAQDKKSQEMLDLVLSKGEFELGIVFDWGDMKTQVKRILVRPEGTLVSTFEAINDVILSDMEAMINAES